MKNGYFTSLARRSVGRITDFRPLLLPDIAVVPAPADIGIDTSGSAFEGAKSIVENTEHGTPVHETGSQDLSRQTPPVELPVAHETHRALPEPIVVDYSKRDYEDFSDLKALKDRQSVESDDHPRDRLQPHDSAARKAGKPGDQPPELADDNLKIDPGQIMTTLYNKASAGRDATAGVFKEGIKYPRRAGSRKPDKGKSQMKIPGERLSEKSVLPEGVVKPIDKNLKSRSESADDTIYEPPIMRPVLADLPRHRPEGSEMTAEPPTISVTIGRIEVKAESPSPKAQPRARPQRSGPKLTLQEYLNRRSGSHK